MSDFEEKNKTYTDLPDLPVFTREASDAPDCAVELLSFDPDAEKNVARTALIERYGLSTAQIDELLKDKATLQTVLDAVVKTNRPRALESANFTVRFNNVSLSTVTPFVRHRIQSISIPQLTDCVRENYIIPASVRDDETLLTAYTDAFTAVPLGRYFLNSLIFTVVTTALTRSCFAMHRIASLSVVSV